MSEKLTILRIICLVFVTLFIVGAGLTFGYFLSKPEPAIWIGWQDLSYDSNQDEVHESYCAFSDVHKVTAVIEKTPHLNHVSEVSGPISGYDKTLVLIQFYSGILCDVNPRSLELGKRINCKEDFGLLQCTYET
ncbi:MAG: hypothetical protein ABIA11_01530 [Patescibacteria group bacterium]